MRAGKGCGGSGAIDWIKSFSLDTDHTEIDPFQLFMQGMHEGYLWNVCRLCMYVLYVWYVCIVCMYVKYVCIVCMYSMYVYVCMYVGYVCRVCM